jgi:phosphate transport system permease protein
MATDTQAIRAIVQRGKHWDKVFVIVGLLCMLVGVLTLALLLAGLVHDGAGRLDWQFFNSFPSRRAARAGILSAIVGSSLVMLITAFAAIPLGIAAGVYLEEYARRNRITEIIEINVTNLAGVPSIVYGLLALGLFVYTFDFGRSILTAGLTLALLILPVIIVSTREAIRAIPGSIREGAFALGSTRWQLVRDHIVPYSTGGILTGVIIGLARAIGETAPVITIGALTFVSFLPPAPVKSEWPFLSFEWLSSPFSVMPIQMFNWMSRPQAAFQENAAAAGIVLVVLTLLMNGTAIWLRARYRKKIKW